jgi:inorganic pyrophosphatase
MVKNLYRDIPVGEKPPDYINIVIEIPLGGSNKVEYNEEEGYFELDRTIYSPLYYPFEYGFIPRTLSGDGDSLDAVLLATRSTFPGCVVRARPVGVLMMRDEKGGDNKIIAAPHEKVDPRFAHVKDMGDINDHTKKEIELFMEDYKKLEPGKYEHVKISGWKNAGFAKNLIRDAMKKFDEG